MPDSHTIAENLIRLTTARTNIATAISGKGGTVAAGAGFEDFPTAIGTIPSGGGDDSFAKLVDGHIITAVIPSGVTAIRDYAFTYCSALTSVTIPSSVTAIGPYAFQNCSALTSVNIPNGITRIASYTFAYCSVLPSITIPSSVTEIASRAFTNCTSLTSIVIPVNVATIGTYAFNSCTGLTSIKFEPTTPPTVANANAWSSVPTTCVIQVPTGSLTAYTTASNYPNPNTYTYVEY